MTNGKYKNLNSNLLNEVVIQFTNYLKQEKINNFRDTRNIKNLIGRPQKISIFNVVSFAFKTINGSKLEDLVENLKEISSYQKYIRKLKRCGILDEIYKNKIINSYVENKLDVSQIHIDSTDVLNLCGTENINYGHKFKNKKASRIHLSLSNNGIPLSVHVTGANKNDSTQLETNLNNIPFKIKTSNKKSTYVVVDKGYMSEKNFKTIEKNYKYKMLCYPKKGSSMTKKHNIMLSNRLNKKQNQEKYIDRLKIERFFALLKKFPNINHRHDRKTNTFMGSILIVLLNIVYMKL
jgi:uncharacterized protein YjaG (DUF416 family)